MLHMIGNMKKKEEKTVTMYSSGRNTEARFHFIMYLDRGWEIFFCQRVNFNLHIAAGPRTKTGSERTYNSLELNYLK